MALALVSVLSKRGSGLGGRRSQARSERRRFSPLEAAGTRRRGWRARSGFQSSRSEEVGCGPALRTRGLALERFSPLEARKWAAGKVSSSVNLSLTFQSSRSEEVGCGSATTFSEGASGFQSSRSEEVGCGEWAAGSGRTSQARRDDVSVLSKRGSGLRATAVVTTINVAAFQSSRSEEVGCGANARRSVSWVSVLVLSKRGSGLRGHRQGVRCRDGAVSVLSKRGSGLRV